MPRLIVCSVLLITGFGLAGCHTVSGNVIPQSGPTMEHIYNSMGIASAQSDAKDSASNAEVDITEIRQTASTSYVEPSRSANTDGLQSFRKLPNPELTLYVYPHFAGSDAVPIPGYYTAFNAYERTHYALPSETVSK